MSLDEAYVNALGARTETLLRTEGHIAPHSLRDVAMAHVRLLRSGLESTLRTDIGIIALVAQIMATLYWQGNPAERQLQTIRLEGRIIDVYRLLFSHQVPREIMELFSDLNQASSQTLELPANTTGPLGQCIVGVCGDVTLWALQQRYRGAITNFESATYFELQAREIERGGDSPSRQQAWERLLNMVGIHLDQGDVTDHTKQVALVQLRSAILPLLVVDP